jgi:predicted nicotinamide N-methyase
MAPAEAIRSTKIAALIAERLPLRSVPSTPQIRIHTAGPASGLSRLTAFSAGAAPYWAYPWPGGMALARYLLDRPQNAAGRRVLDLGAGCGLVAIAAAMAGATDVLAAEIDSVGCEALRLNAAANSVEVRIIEEDVTKGDPPAVDLIAAGDVFYDPALAERMLVFLERAAGAGIAVLIGDPGRAYLPESRLDRLAAYPVRDFGDSAEAAPTTGSVYALSSRTARSVA